MLLQVCDAGAEIESQQAIQAYLLEMPFRFNNRKNPHLFRDTLIRLLASENLEYKELIQAAA